jgi:hypothetical protein
MPPPHPLHKRRAERRHKLDSLGRSIITNVAAHCGKPAILRFDLVDLVPSVSLGTRVPALPHARLSSPRRTAAHGPVHHENARRCVGAAPPAPVTARTSSRAGGSSLGTSRRAPTSPALANLAANRLDRRLSGLATAAGCVYTRYADDLIYGTTSSASATYMEVYLLLFRNKVLMLGSLFSIFPIACAGPAGKRRSPVRSRIPAGERG